MSNAFNDACYLWKAGVCIRKTSSTAGVLRLVGRHEAGCRPTNRCLIRHLGCPHFWGVVVACATDNKKPKHPPPQQPQVKIRLDNMKKWSSWLIFICCSWRAGQWAAIYKARQWSNFIFIEHFTQLWTLKSWIRLKTCQCRQEERVSSHFSLF